MTAKLVALIAALTLSGTPPLVQARERVVRRTSDGTTTYTRWTAGGQSYIHMRQQPLCGSGGSSQLLVHPTGDRRTVRSIAHSHGVRTRTTSWQLAAGVVAEHRVTTERRTGRREVWHGTYGRRNSTDHGSDRAGRSHRSRLWQLNPRQIVFQCTIRDESGRESRLRTILPGTLEGSPHRRLLRHATGVFER